MSMSLSTSTTLRPSKSTDRMSCAHVNNSLVIPDAIDRTSLNPPPPSTPECLEAIPATRSWIVEMEDAIRFADDKHPYHDSVETDNELDNDSAAALIAGLSQPKSVLPAAIYLRSYLRGACLPQLYRAARTSLYADVVAPLPGDPAKRNRLVILPNQKRKISQIRKFPREIFNKATQLYHLENIYGSEDYATMINTGGLPAPSPDEALTLTSFIGQRYINPEVKVTMSYPRHLPRLIEWLDNYPLRTLTRAIHLANPSTVRWWFDRILPQELGEDFMKNRRTLAVLGWRFHPEKSNRPWFRELDDEMGWAASRVKGINFLKVHPHKQPWFIPSPEVSLAIIIQPPWVLGWHDFKNVARCKDLPEIPDTNPDVDPSKHYNMAQRVWCQIRDACQKLNTKYFVLTTYEGWLFGKFGGGIGGSGYIPGLKDTHIRNYIDLDSFQWCGHRMKIAPWTFDQWTYVETSELLSFDASNPTIMQFLYFWTARSMGLKKSREIALQIRLTDEEIKTAERLTTYVPEEPSKLPPYCETYEFQHHTGNRSRQSRPSPSPPRFTPYPARPSRQAANKTSSATSLFSFIKGLGKYLTGTGS